MTYIDLSNKAFELGLQAQTTAANRTLEYIKATFEVVSKPYAATTPDAFVKENATRAGSLVELRDKFLRDSAAQVTAFANTGVQQAQAWQQTAQAALQGLGNIFASNLNYVKEATGHQIDGFVKHVETASKNAK